MFLMFNKPHWLSNAAKNIWCDWVSFGTMVQLLGNLPAFIVNGAAITTILLLI